MRKSGLLPEPLRLCWCGDVIIKSDEGPKTWVKGMIYLPHFTSSIIQAQVGPTCFKYLPLYLISQTEEDFFSLFWLVWGPLPVQGPPQLDVWKWLLMMLRCGASYGAGC